MEWYYYLLSIVPILESRYSIPFLLQFYDPIEVFVVVTFLNILTTIFSFFFLVWFHKEMYPRFYWYKKVYDVIEEIINKKLEKLRGFNGYFLIFINTIIPIPIFGYYSSILMSWLLRLDPKKSILVISVGIVIINIIETFLLGWLAY